MPDVTRSHSAIQTIFLIALSIVSGWMLFTVPSWSALETRFFLALSRVYLRPLAFG